MIENRHIKVGIASVMWVANKMIQKLPMPSFGGKFHQEFCVMDKWCCKEHEHKEKQDQEHGNGRKNW